MILLWYENIVIPFTVMLNKIVIMISDAQRVFHVQAAPVIKSDYLVTRCLCLIRQTEVISCLFWSTSLTLSIVGCEH